MYLRAKTHAGFRDTIKLMAKHRQPDEEESRLLAIAEAWRSDESVASNALTNPPHSLLYSEYQRLLDGLKAIRLKCHQSRIVLRAHRHKMRH